MGGIYWFGSIIYTVIAIPSLIFFILPFWAHCGASLYCKIYLCVIFYKHLLDIPLSYYIFKFKKNNFLLIQNISFSMFINVFWKTGRRFFLPEMPHYLDEICLHEASAGIIVLTLIEYILLTIFYYRKKNEKKYKNHLTITLCLIFIFTINIIMCYFYIGGHSEENILANLGEFIGIGLPLGILSAKTLIALFYTPYLFYELGRRWVVRFKENKAKKLN